MSVIEELKEEVTAIATERGLLDSRAFGYWFLETIEDLSEEEAETHIVDGPWDHGRDAVVLDENESQLTIYQFKYTESLNYAVGAFSDIQSGVQAEAHNLSQVDKVRLVVVTLATADAAFKNTEKKAQRRIRGWLTRNKHKCYAEVEVFDLTKFAQIRERLYGVQTTATFKGTPVESDDALLGLIDASDLALETDRDELFAFNVRQFLGVRRGSVNAVIKESLEDEDKRGMFWMLNNGIVCLCTNYHLATNSQYGFENLTIVNGAQTISTIARFLDENSAVTEPIWVVAKILTVGEQDIDRARELTKTSNTQTPTSSKDLRASDISHRRLRDWFSDHLSIQYLYRRGDKAIKGKPVVQMKDLAQAYVAFWDRQPHISFAQVGKIFGDNELYSKTFPGEEIAILRQHGSSEEINDFLESRLLAHGLLQDIRGYLRSHVQEKSYRSLAYHILWVYSKLFEELGIDDQIHTLCERHTEIVNQTLERLLDSLIDSFIPYMDTFPRVLKSTQATEVLGGSLGQLSGYTRAKTEIPKLLEDQTLV